MRTSLNEIAEIENHLSGNLSPEDSLLFTAKRIIDPELENKVKWQRKTYRLIQLYGRRKMKAELEKIHHTLFTEVQHESFRNKIIRIFK